MKRKLKEIKKFITDLTMIEIIIIIFIMIILLCLPLQPYFEAKAFNRLTGQNVTYWDAVFLKLRVQPNIPIEGNNQNATRFPNKH